ncbi:hypothetical protein [Dolichospermum flos-aquae]|uniref:hypothetical protein n=1 Tax=Dolichospermum flosaquae TaxID=1166 RepID=UPI00398AE55C
MPLYYGEIKINADNKYHPAPDLVKNNWEFTEVWIDPMLSPPYISKPKSFSQKAIPIKH